MDRRVTWRMHRVERGETLAQIAKEFATPANSIAQANNRLEEAPEAGDLLIIPASYTPEAPAARSSMTKRPPVRHGKAVKTPRKTLAARPVPERVLHHRASNRTIKTAAIHVPRDSE